MVRRDFISATLAASLGIFLPAMGRAKIVPVTPAQPVEAAGKIEVIEFFSYACPHCNDFLPTINKWQSKLPAKVAFRRVPVSFGRAAWGNLAKLYYALDALGELQRLDSAVFAAIHQQNLELYKNDKAIAWAASQGVNADKLGAMLQSFAVASKVSVAEKLALAYRVESIPSMAVNGKAMVFAEGGFDKMLADVDSLIAKELGASKANGKK